jgi:serine/threonine protein kinase
MECFRLLPPHPNIVRLIDSNVNQKNKDVLDYYILMEFCSRGDLVDVMKARSMARAAASAARDSGSGTNLTLGGTPLVLQLAPPGGAGDGLLEKSNYDSVGADISFRVSDAAPTTTTDEFFNPNCQRGRAHALFSESELLRLISDVTNAVAHLHSTSSALCHLDICAENVLLSDDGRFKLCDFGACTNVRSLSEPGWCPPMPARMGYCSPEQVLRFREHSSSFLFTNSAIDESGNAVAPEKGADPYAADFPLTEKMDIWALGSLLHKLAFLRLPFEDEFRPANHHSLFELYSHAHSELSGSGSTTAAKMPMQPRSCLVDFNDDLFYTKDFHNLIQCMLQLHPTRRPSARTIVQKVVEMPCWLPHLTPTENKAQSVHNRRASGITISSSNLQSLQNHYSHHRRLSARSVKQWVHGKMYKGEAEKQRWLIKATSSQVRAPPKPKYVCRIVLDIWENPSLYSTFVLQVPFSNITLPLPLRPIQFVSPICFIP